MATDRQVAYYKSLCQQLGQAPEDDFENLTIMEETAEKVLPTCNVTKLPCAGCNPCCEHREE